MSFLGDFFKWIPPAGEFHSVAEWLNLAPVGGSFVIFFYLWLRCFFSECFCLMLLRRFLFVSGQVCDRSVSVVTWMIESFALNGKWLVNRLHLHYTGPPGMMHAWSSIVLSMQRFMHAYMETYPEYSEPKTIEDSFMHVDRMRRKCCKLCMYTRRTLESYRYVVLYVISSFNFMQK